MKIQQAKTEKRTIRTGRRIGLKSNATISITVNDEDRTVSRLWEMVKKYHSGQKITAAETARKVIMRGLTAELEEIMLATSNARREENESLQGRLFDGI